MKYFAMILLITTSIIGNNILEASNLLELDWSQDIKAFKSAQLLNREVPLKGSSIKSMAVNIDKAFLIEKLSQYSGAKEVIIEGSKKIILERRTAKGRELARNFLKQEYEKLGYKVSMHKYGTFRKGANFIAEKTGISPAKKILIISSHIDSVDNAGANDDGTGTISALAIAKTLAKYDFKHTLRIVGFDQEELGLVGSKKYVKTLSKSRVLGDIHLEMMGTNARKDGVFHVIDCDKAHSIFITAHIAKAIVAQSVDLRINKACTTRSDHDSFWKASLPAVVISENFFGGDSDTCYHRKCDVFDSRLDFEYMKNITQAVAFAAKEILILE